MKNKIPPIFSHSLLSLLMLFILVDVTYADTRNNGSRDGILKIKVSDRNTNAPLKANIYIQLPNGVHIDKRTYTNRARFRLAPGNYKVTVKAQYKVDTVRFVRVHRGEAVRESFVMRNLRRSSHNRHSPNYDKGYHPRRDHESRGRRDYRKGKLTIYLDGRRTDRPIKSRLIVHDRQGNQVASFYNTKTAQVKLAAGVYTVTAKYRRRHASKPIHITSGKSSMIRFNAYDFNHRRH